MPERSADLAGEAPRLPGTPAPAQEQPSYLLRGSAQPLPYDQWLLPATALLNPDYQQGRVIWGLLPGWSWGLAAWFQVEKEMRRVSRPSDLTLLPAVGLRRGARTALLPANLRASRGTDSRGDRTLTVLLGAAQVSVR